MNARRLLVAKFLRTFAGSRAWFWFATMVALPFFHLNLQKLAFVILEVSLYANMESAWTNYEAGRADVHHLEDTDDEG